MTTKEYMKESIHRKVYTLKRIKGNLMNLLNPCLDVAQGQKMTKDKAKEIPMEVLRQLVKLKRIIIKEV